MLNPRNLGIAGGLVWGLSILLSTILALLTDYSTQFHSILMDMYPGYSISWGGTLIGFIYGFIDGFIGFFLIGWINNWLTKRSRPSKDTH